MAPPVLLILAAVAVVLGVTSLLAGAPWRTGAWFAGAGLVACVVGWLLNLPAAAAWSWDGLTATAARRSLRAWTDRRAASWTSATLGLSVLALAFYVPVVTGLLLARAWRLTWAARSAGLVVVFVTLAVLQDRDAPPRAGARHRHAAGAGGPRLVARRGVRGVVVLERRRRRVVRMAPAAGGAVDGGGAGRDVPRAGDPHRRRLVRSRRFDRRAGRAPARARPGVRRVPGALPRRSPADARGVPGAGPRHRHGSRPARAWPTPGTAGSRPTPTATRRCGRRSTRSPRTARSVVVDCSPRSASATSSCRCSTAVSRRRATRSSPRVACSARWRRSSTSACSTARRASSSTRTARRCPPPRSSPARRPRAAAATTPAEIVQTDLERRHPGVPRSADLGA